jgi:hypothetical protein
MVTFRCVPICVSLRRLVRLLVTVSDLSSWDWTCQRLFCSSAEAPLLYEYCVHGLTMYRPNDSIFFLQQRSGCYIPSFSLERETKYHKVGCRWCSEDHSYFKMLACNVARRSCSWDNQCAWLWTWICTSFTLNILSPLPHLWHPRFSPWCFTCAVGIRVTVSSTSHQHTKCHCCRVSENERNYCKHIFLQLRRKDVCNECAEGIAHCIITWQNSFIWLRIYLHENANLRRETHFSRCRRVSSPLLWPASNRHMPMLY